MEDNLAVRLLEEAAAEQSAVVAAAAHAEAIALNPYLAGTVGDFNVIVRQAAHLAAAQRSANDLAARRLVAAAVLAKNAGGSWRHEGP